MCSSVDGVVEVELSGEPEPVPQRTRQQAGPGGGADQGEARDLQRDGGRAGTLADHDVDPEVLHGQVEHLLGRPGHPVDLVEEEDLALDQTGQDRGQIAGVLDGRAAGDPQRGRHLAGDDHGQGRLAQARRAGQQHVVGYAAAVPRRLEHQPELVADPRLTLELGQGRRPQRRLGGPLVGIGVGPDQGRELLVAELTHRLLPGQGSAAPPASATATLMPPDPRRPAARPRRQAASASRADQPRPCRPWDTCSRHAPVARGGPIGSSLQPGDRVDLVLELDDDPLGALAPDARHLAQLDQVLGRDGAGAARPGLSTASAAWASLGPTPVAVSSSSKNSRSSAEANPYRVSESSRTISEVARVARCPTRRLATVFGLQSARMPRPPTSITAEVGPDLQHRSAELGDHRQPRLPVSAARWPGRLHGGGLHRGVQPSGGAAPPDVADGQGQRVRGVGRLGRVVQPEDPGHHGAHLVLRRPGRIR